MKAAIIGASEESLYTIKKAHEYGITVIALDGNPDAAGFQVSDSSIVVDISDEKHTIDVLERVKPDFLLTVPIGRYLTTVGAANDVLRLPGISREMAVLCTDKFLFHKKLQTESLRPVRCYNIIGLEAEDTDRTIYSGEAKIKEEMPLSFPAILKPRYGSGSRGIHMLTDTKQMIEALHQVSGEPYVLEECAVGEEYGVDGAVIEGRFYMILLRKKENTPPPARQAVAYFSVLPHNRLWKQIYDYMEKVIGCLGLNECLLHADIIQTTEVPFTIEISARPSGHNLHNLFTPLCTGIDPAKEYIKHRLGLPCNFVTKEVKPMLIHYFDMLGKVKTVPGQEKIQQETGAKVVAWECNIKKGEELVPVSDGHSLMGRGFFVLEGENSSKLLQQAEHIKQLFFCV